MLGRSPQPPCSRGVHPSRFLQQWLRSTSPFRETLAQPPWVLGPPCANSQDVRDRSLSCSRCPAGRGRREDLTELSILVPEEILRESPVLCV